MTSKCIQAAAVVLIAASLLQDVQALTEGLGVHLESDCADKLTTLYDTYYPPPAGTKCRGLINSSLTVTDPALCPDAAATMACFNQQQVQWMAFVATCEVFHWSDLNRGPVVSPFGDQSGMDPASSAAYTSAPAEPGNNAEGRRLLTSVNGAINSLSTIILSDTSGPTVVNGCFPTLRDPRHFYLYLEGKPLGADSAAGQRFAAEAIVAVTGAAVATLFMLLA